MRPVTSSVRAYRSCASIQSAFDCAGRLGVLERELEVARAQRQPRERVLARGHVRERLVQRAHDRRRRARVRLVAERFEHERETRSRIVDRADERFELGDRARHAIRARLEDAEIPGRPLVVGSELAPTLRRPSVLAP